MTWGNQNTEDEGHAQLDYAFSQGINFIDTAELYPVPATAETQGRTSEIIGTWLKKTGNRDKVILASKIAGPGDYTAHIRTTGFKGNSIEEAVNNELKRLQTDYIDLFQLLLKSEWVLNSDSYSPNSILIKTDPCLASLAQQQFPYQ